MLLLKIFLLSNLYLVSGENCSSATSCTECLLLDEACYWCEALATEKSISGCLRFNIDNIAKLLCPNQWTHSKDTCSAYANNDNIDLMKSALLSSLNYKDKLSEITNNYFNNGDDYETQAVNKDNLSPEQLLGTEAKGSDLKNLLHKLLILKLLRKIKNKDTVLTEEEKDLLYKLSDKSVLHTAPAATTTPTTTTTTTTTARTGVAKKTDELSELLRLLRNEAERRLHAANAVISEENKRNKAKSKVNLNGIKNNFNSVDEKTDLNSIDVKATVEQMLQEEKATFFPTELIPQSKPMNLSSTVGKSTTIDKIISTDIKTTRGSIVTGYNHIEKVDVKYEEMGEESLAEFTKKKVTSRYLNTTAQTIIKSTTKKMTDSFQTSHLQHQVTYCKLFEDNDLCNSDHNCTWCNTLDICIYRNKDSYKSCVKNVENMVDDEYGLDRCFKAKHCKQCVQDDKCYWCDMSQRCHTYPFFGYVPNSCGGDWYVKQCDVQLAVIIVVLPLIIILLGMVTFYFCLKYCHYRQKVLRVPLFEKPGIFDYRKDKKVYFVNPEDESSDDELAKEKMRKKYRIPIEKEPLIDPNT